MREAKLFYFLYFSALSWLFPFLNLFFRRWGLTPSQIGTIGCVRPLVSFAAGSAWSGLADKARRHRAVLLLTSVASLLARLSIAMAGPYGYGALLAIVTATELFSAPVCILVDSAVMAACDQQADYGKHRLWGAVGWGICSAVAGEAISRAGLWAAFAGHAVLAVAALVPTLRLDFRPLHAKLSKRAGAHADDGWGHGGKDQQQQQQEQQEQQEQQQQQQQQQDLELSGDSDGGGLAPSDSVAEARSLLHKSAAGGKAGGDSAGPHSINAGDAEQQQQQQHGGKQQPRVYFWRSLRQLLANPQAAIFLAQALFMGFGVGNIEGYLFLYIDELGGSELLMGVSLSVTCAAETLVFYFLPLILRMGIRRCMHLVFAAFLLRMSLYSSLKYAPTPWLVLPAEILHGLTFALAWGGGSAHCAQLAPPGLEATTQGLFQGLYFGVGVGMGSLAGGHVYHRLGAQAVYLVACAVLAAGWALTSLAQLTVALLKSRGSAAVQREVKYSQVSALEMNEPSSSRYGHESLG